MADDFLVCDLYFNPNICHTCKVYNNNIKTCKGCYLISYCCKDCQRIHWNSHKDFCICIQTLRKQIGFNYYDHFKCNVNTNASSDKQEDKIMLQAKRVKDEQIDISKEPINDSKMDQLIDDNDLMKEKSELIDLLNNEHSVAMVNNKIETLSMSQLADDENILGRDVETECCLSVGKNLEQGFEAISSDVKLKIQKDWDAYKFGLLYLVEKVLTRPIRNIEKEIIMNPKACVECKSNKNNTLCETCLTVNYCPGHIQSGHHAHAHHCDEYLLSCEISRHIVRKYFDNSFKYIEFISNYLEPLKLENDLDYFDLSEYLSYCKTLDFLIRSSNLSNQNLCFHIIGASEYECSPYSVYLWENLLHLNENLLNIKIIFIGFSVVSDQFEMKLCENCLKNGKRIQIESYQMSYHAFVESEPNQLYDEPENKMIPFHKVDLIVAYNSGFHEFENKDCNTWTETLIKILNAKYIPFAFTAYTEQEIVKDTNIFEDLAHNLNINLKCIVKYEINKQSGEKPRLDPEGGVYYLNKYVTCYESV